MLVLDSKMPDTAIFNALANMIQANKVKGLPDLFQEAKGFKHDSVKYAMGFAKDFVMLYLPEVQRDIIDSCIDLSVIVFLDLNNDTDGTSFDRILTKYNIQYRAPYWYENILELTTLIMEGGDIKKWEPTPRYEDEEDIENDSDLEAFLNELDDEDEGDIEDDNYDEDDPL